MQASIHPIQSGRAKVGSWVVGREGTPGLVLSACGGENEALIAAAVRVNFYFLVPKFLSCLSVWFFIIHPIPSVGGRRERLSRVVA